MTYIVQSETILILSGYLPLLNLAIQTVTTTKSSYYLYFCYYNAVAFPYLDLLLQIIEVYNLRVDHAV